MPLGSKLTPPRGSQFYIELYKEKFKRHLLLNRLMVIWPNSAGMVPGWSSTKIVQMVLIGCICRSWGQKIGFQNATSKTLLVWNYKAQSFHIYIASFGVLCKLLHCDPWPFPQASDLRPFGPSCYLNETYVQLKKTSWTWVYFKIIFCYNFKFVVC